MSSIRSAFTLVLCLGLISVGFGQQPAPETAVAKDAGAAKKAESPRENVMRLFNEVAPKIGDPLPDISAYDAEGNEFKLRSLKGHYTVLVFGCLT